MPDRPSLHLLPPEERLSLATDLYQLTMMAAYRASSPPAEEAVFELSVRRLPAPRAFLVAAGLEQALAAIEALRFTGEDVAWLRELPVFAHVSADFFEWLRAFRFTGSVDAVLEGTVLFPDEPLLRVRAPLAEAQLLETLLLNIVNTQTLLASKAARVRLAAPDRTLIDFGTRRAHGTQAALYAARASWLAGLDGTSNVLAGRLLGIPLVGTAAHSFILSFAEEEDAFRAYLRSFPERTTLLVDTYDTLAGTRRAARLGPRLGGIRLDSGDLEELAFACRALLDDAGRPDVRIVASGDLEEHKIAALLSRGAPIDAFGVGTELVTSRDEPSLSGVYKLVERRPVRGAPVPVRKRSTGKATLPGEKQVHRLRDAQGGLVADVLARTTEPAPAPPPGGTVAPLLREVLRDGARAVDDATLSLDAARARCRAEVASLPETLRRLRDFGPPPVRVSDGLSRLAAHLDERARGAR